MGRTISVKIRPLNKVCAVSLSINAVIKVVSSNIFEFFHKLSSFLMDLII